jgi:hypothetical protein
MTQQIIISANRDVSALYTYFTLSNVAVPAQAKRPTFLTLGSCRLYTPQQVSYPKSML